MKQYRYVMILLGRHFKVSQWPHSGHFSNWQLQTSNMLWQKDVSSGYLSRKDVLLDCRKCGQKRPSCCQFPQALPYLQSHLAYGYILPWAACLQLLSRAGQQLLQSPSPGWPNLCQSWITARLFSCPNSFFSLSFTINILYPKLCLRVHFQRTQFAIYVFFIYVLSCSAYHKSQENACVYPFFRIIMILKSTLFRI